MRRIFRLGDNEKEIIKMIGLGTFVLASFVFPNLPMALRPFLKERGPNNFLKMIKKLRNKNVISLGGEKIRLTTKGRQILKQIEIGEINIDKPESWDGIWRIISYDIPNTSKKKRDWFRINLERLGFQKIQESLWVYPFECKEEIAVMSQDLGILPYVIYMTTEHLPNQFALEKYFNLIK